MIPEVLWLVLKLFSTLFFINFILTILDILHFHINFRIILLISTKNLLGFWIDILANWVFLWTNYVFKQVFLWTSYFSSFMITKNFNWVFSYVIYTWQVRKYFSFSFTWNFVKEYCYIFECYYSLSMPSEHLELFCRKFYIMNSMFHNIC